MLRTTIAICLFCVFALTARAIAQPAPIITTPTTDPIPAPIAQPTQTPTLPTNPPTQSIPTPTPMPTTEPTPVLPPPVVTIPPLPMTTPVPPVIAPTHPSVLPNPHLSKPVPAITYALPSGGNLSFTPPSGDGGFNPVTVLGPPKTMPKTKTEEGEPRLWMGGVEFGLNGSEGNSQLLKIRLGTNAKRKTDDNILVMDLFYGFATQNSVRNENKALYTVRDEMIIDGSSWSPFLAGAAEYDEFRDYNMRAATHTGFSYQFWKSPESAFKTRIGAGTSVEFSDENTKWVPEGLLGYDLVHRLGDRQRLISTADFFPDLANFERYRIRVRAAYEILVDPESNLTLRLGIQDRYDSKPGKARPNDLDFFATLMFQF